MITAIDRSSTTGPAQALLLSIYGTVCRTGLFSTTLGRNAFLIAYHRYKTWAEAAQVSALRALVPKGSTVVDVGANVGFYTRHFANWVGPEGKVIAIEPEAANFASLKRMTLRKGCTNVDPIQAVAAEVPGTLKLQINPFHPADHRISSSGIDVRALTLDDLLLKGDRPPLSLIKIDVQGAEEKVLRGATAVLRDLRPALFLEVDHAALAAMGSSAESLLGFLSAHGYQLCRLGKGQPSRLDLDSAIRLCRPGTYTDFLAQPIC
jgi:FkbM family methyltransferase